MKYCPSCQSEYLPEVAVCADCGEALVDALPEGTTAEQVVVFLCGDQQTADRVRTVILGELNAFVRNLGSSSFPAPGAHAGEVVVVVEAAQAEAARALLDAAFESGELDAADGAIAEPG